MPQIAPPWQCIRSGILMIPIPARRIEAMPSMPSMRDCYLHHVSSVEKKRIKALIFFFRVNLHFTSKSVWGLDSMKRLQTFLCLRFPYYCSKHSMSALHGDQRSGIKGDTFFSWAAQPEQDPQQSCPRELAWRQHEDNSLVHRLPTSTPQPLKSRIVTRT